MTRFFKKSKKGSTLVELIGVMIVIAIIAAIAVGGIIAARDRANVTNTRSDLRTYENAVKQVMMAYPNIMKYEDATTVDGDAAITHVIDLINAQLETEWKFTQKFDNGTAAVENKSGAVAYSETKRDAWGMPYALYIYTDSQDTAHGYTNKDSVLYLTIASAGKNSTGVGVGTQGKNINQTTGAITDQNAMINNTDGIDDMGLIVRIKNGDVYSATFGYEGATLGDLKDTYWVFGVAQTGTGVHYCAKDASTPTVTKADTLDTASGAGMTEATLATSHDGTWA